jgi:putative transposase
LERPEEPNTTWSLDFVSDAVECGRKFRVLNIIDDCDRFAIAQEVSMSMPAKRVIKILEKVIWLNGKPKNIRCDNGPEFIAADFQNWCRGNDINILFIQPGCPTQNSYIERFNGSYRRAVLDAYIFRNLNEAREQTEIWRTYYNEQRPHESLENMTPIEYRMNKAV